MFDDAAMVLEEIAPEDKTHNEVPGARVNLYMATKKWEMAASVAKSSGEGRARRSRLMDQFAYATRRAAEVHIEERFATVFYRLACCRSSRQRTTSLEHSRRVGLATLELSCFQETFRRVNSATLA
jgi:hypothetical protein